MIALACIKIPPGPGWSWAVCTLPSISTTRSTCLQDEPPSLEHVVTAPIQWALVGLLHAANALLRFSVACQLIDASN
ncbi:MAG: hypothetical protein CMN94_08025 [Synechococcus sp. EAC657]|nr:hypothetical protein [Synechococcus sp. EAC657]